MLNFLSDHLPFSRWFGTALTLPRQEGIRRRQKRRESPSLHHPSLFPHRDAGERDGLPENGRSPHWVRRKNCLFWRAGCPLAGAWDPCSFFEKILFFFSTKLE